MRNAEAVPGAGRYACAVVTRDAVARAHRHPAEAHYAWLIEIVDGGEASRLICTQGRLADFTGRQLRVARDRDWAVAAVPGSIAEVEILLEPLQPGQHVVEAPVRIAVRAPVVKSRRRPAQRVTSHPTRSADELVSAQLVHPAERVRLRGVPPIEVTSDAPAVDQLWRQFRARIRAGLQQQNGAVARFSESARYDAAGGTGAHDHHVEMLGVWHIEIVTPIDLGRTHLPAASRPLDKT